MSYNNSLFFREQIRLLERKLGLLSKEKGCCSISLSQCHALVEIGRNPNVMLKELAETLTLDISTTSRCVDNLVKKELVQRLTSSNDRRCIEIALTEKGLHLFYKIEEEMNKKFTEVFSHIPMEERESVIKSLNTILTSFDQCSL